MRDTEGVQVPISDNPVVKILKDQSNSQKVPSLFTSEGGIPGNRGIVLRAIPSLVGPNSFKDTHLHSVSYSRPT